SGNDCSPYFPSWPGGHEKQCSAVHSKLTVLQDPKFLDTQKVPNKHTQTSTLQIASQLLPSRRITHLDVSRRRIDGKEKVLPLVHPHLRQSCIVVIDNV